MTESRDERGAERKRSPIEIMIDASDMRCTVCGAKMGACDCWTKCACGWSYRKGTACRNPAHGRHG